AGLLLMGLAENLYQVGDWAKGGLMFEQFLTFYPNDSMAPAARYFLAECQRRRGDLDGARAAFTDLKNDPNAQSHWRELAAQGLRDLEIDSASHQFGLMASAAAEGNSQP
ncbi:MAG: tetratricopeptide repeat protein, partial [Candidatus Sumerlaeota bacterium]|nr:tetratricopeptide repeat protein [Candidatus Sumerlaeota bacterium]